MKNSYNSNMNNSIQYKAKENCSVLFEEGTVFVVEIIAPEPVGTYYMVANEEHMFTQSEKPLLQLQSLKDSIQEYITLKEDSVKDDNMDELLIQQNQSKNED
jgi:hypothetical protein